MIREGKIHGDALHVRVPHALKMELMAKAQDKGVTLSELVLGQLKAINDNS
jgi:hypothetical protein|tara:strand:+ start:477 stop:629 length:153 start_codon:yes stop_codon:yes gene_type:complete